MATYRDYNPSRYNDFISPPHIWEDIKQFIPKNKIISMPFYCDGECGNDMRNLGFNVIHNNEDFFENDRGDIVIDNPPFELKKKIIEKLVERNKPFILILPVSTICYMYSKILKEHIQIIIPKRRIKFIHYNKITKERDPDWFRKNNTFDCLYICWKMNLKNNINYL